MTSTKSELSQVINPSAYPIATSLVPPERRATAVAVRSSWHICIKLSISISYPRKVLESCYGLGLMFGPPLGGILYSLAGFYLPFWFSGVSFTIHQIKKKTLIS